MDDLTLWLRLWRTQGLGPVKINALLERFGSVQAVFSASHSALHAAGLNADMLTQLFDSTHDVATEAALVWQEEAGNHILTLASPAYPHRLKESTRPPAVLFVKGDVNILSDPQLAMVGSRNPSQNGIDNAFQLAKHLGQSGIITTSGLALGVDGASHQGALAASVPTIAVVATGLDRVYPARHKTLAQQIIDGGGAIVSELPLGSSPKAENFPARNRIIAGLSVGTLVVEAAVRSGSLITARYAREIGREVFAIPGSIHNPMSKGCHALIKQGAKLVESAADILEELESQLREVLLDTPRNTHADSLEEPALASNKAAVPDDHQRVLDSMGFDPISMDQLSHLTGFSAAELSSMLLIMELEGWVSTEPGGRYLRRK